VFQETTYSYKTSHGVFTLLKSAGRFGFDTQYGFGKSIIIIVIQNLSAVGDLIAGGWKIQERKLY
jgi:hypothetical protein